jgi:hypothetical protein
MRKFFIVLFILSGFLAISQDSLKRNVFVFQFGAVKALYNPSGKGLSYDGIFNVGALAKKCFLVQTGLEYNRSSYTIDQLTIGHFDTEKNNTYVYHQLSVPLYFNFLSPKRKIMLGGGALTDFYTLGIHTYDYYSYDPFNQSSSSSKNQRTADGYVNPLHLSLCLKFDYILKVNKIGFSFGLRGYFPLYTFQLEGTQSFWNNRTCLNVGILF